MSVYVLIVVLVLLGLLLAWVLHRRQVDHMLPLLARLAAETNGVVRWRNPLLMPKLSYTWAGLEVELSSASTGIAGQSVQYTYVLFQGLAPDGFEFRIRARSAQALGDAWIGLARPMAGDGSDLDEHVVIETNDENTMREVLSERVRADLLHWAGRKPNALEDVRRHGDSMIYAVTGRLRTYGELRRLLDTATRFVDRLRASGTRAAANAAHGSTG